MNRTILLITSFLIGVVSAFAQAAFNAPGTGNPVIPGYFAGPTIKKFGDTYYMRYRILPQPWSNFSIGWISSVCFGSDRLSTNGAI